MEEKVRSNYLFFQIEMQLRKGEPIPHGWAQGPDGKETTDAQVVSPT